MKRQLSRAVIPALLIAALLASALSGCAAPDAQTPEQPTESPPDDAGAIETAHPVIIGNDLFTMRYDPNSTLNPITCKNAGNLLLSSLMYEGLFVLDANFEAQNVLCDTYEQTGFMVYKIIIRTGVYLNDGSELSAVDVAYTLNRARTDEDSLYIKRLAGVESVSVEDARTVIITLSSPNSQFIKLLDIPIIKDGGIDWRVPVGTGPYIYESGDEPLLTAFPLHRDFYRLPVSVVHLMECSGGELLELFSDGIIDLLCDDPTGPLEFMAGRLHDIRYFDTSTLQYIGFNTRGEAIADPNFRRAVGFAVDREYIVGTIMSGQALASPLAISPANAFYDAAWVGVAVDPYIEISKLLSGIGLADTDNDSYLEYPAEYGGYTPFELDFIVNSENEYKITAANSIAETLRHVGINITVRELSWEAFLTALSEGDFDMYYGDLPLSADFDLSPLLLPESAYDFGTGNSRYETLIRAYLTAGTPDAQTAAARVLCSEISSGAPFIPVLYKKRAMRSGRGVITGALPTQSSVFYNLTGWTITLSGQK